MGKESLSLGTFEGYSSKKKKKWSFLIFGQERPLSSFKSMALPSTFITVYGPM